MDVKSQREQLGVSQLCLAKEANVSRFRIHLHERHGLELTTAELDQIRKVLTRKADDLRGVISKL
jgi:hypothetical protein